MQKWASLYGSADMKSPRAIAGLGTSAVWLGINHNISGHGPPPIFGTVIFGDSLDSDYQAVSDRSPMSG